MDVTTMSRSLDRLEESGYLVREKDPGCRRSYLICLTGEGVAEAHKVRQGTGNGGMDVELVERIGAG